MEANIMSTETFKYMFKTTVKVNEYIIESFTYCALEGENIVATTYMKLQEEEVLVPIGKNKTLKNMSSLNAMEKLAQSIAIYYAPKVLPDLLFQKDYQWQKDILVFNNYIQSVDAIRESLERKELKDIFVRLIRGE